MEVTLSYPIVFGAGGAVLTEQVTRQLPPGRCLEILPSGSKIPLNSREEADWIMEWYNQDLSEMAKYRAIEYSKFIMLGDAVTQSLAKESCTRVELLGKCNGFYCLRQSCCSNAIDVVLTIPWWRNKN